MPAYVIVDITVNDPARYEEYKKLAAPTVAAYGGKYIVRGSPVHVLEGNWLPKRLVILKFESIEQAKKWWASPEYHNVKKIRHETAATNMIVVEGI